MRKACVILNIALVMCVFHCCHSNNNGDQLLFPTEKQWAHRVDDIPMAIEREKYFEGIEVDLVYSPQSNKLFVCHNEEDTTKRLAFDRWMEAMTHPEKHYYWLDVKNLNYFTADSISVLIRRTLEPYGLLNKAFIESFDTDGIVKAKDHGLHTSLWVDNFYWSHLDTLTWYNKVKGQIEKVQPDCISCEYRMFGALTTFFPEQNILLWHTPAELTPENAELTYQFTQHPSVKVVLVDYEKPSRSY